MNKKNSYRNIIFWLLFGTLAFIVYTHLAEVRKIFTIIVGSNWKILVVALILESLYYIFYAKLYQKIFAIFELFSGFRTFLSLILSSTFINVALPVAGISSVGLFVDNALSKKQSASKTALASFLTIWIDLASFAFLSIFALLLLHRYIREEKLLTTALAILSLSIIALVVLFIFASRKSDWLKKLFTFINNLSHSILKIFFKDRQYGSGWVDQTILEIKNLHFSMKENKSAFINSFLYAVFTHLVSALTFLAIILAFEGRILIVPALLGYLASTLLMIVSITPQGIGFAEGGAILVLVSLGIDLPSATAIALTYRAISFWLPFFIGFYLLRKTVLIPEKKGDHHSDFFVKLISIVTVLTGMLNVFSAIKPAFTDRLAIIMPYLPFAILNGARLATAIFGFSLIVISLNLYHRKRMAWLVAEVVLIVSSILHIVKGLDYEESLILLGVAALLWFQRFNFHAESDRPSIVQGLRAALLSLVFTLIYGITGFYLLDRHFAINFSLRAAFNQTLSMFSSFQPVIMPITKFGHYFLNSVYVIATMTMAYTLFMLLRPVFLRHRRDLLIYNKAKKIIEQHGKTSLAPFLLFEGKEYFFDTASSAVIGYIVKNGVAVVLGDPVGPKEKIPKIITEFQKFCYGNGWQTSFYQVLPDYLGYYEKANFKVLKIGSEAIVDLNAFTLLGAENKKLRNVHNKLDRSGYKPVIYNPPLDNKTLLDLREISDEWLASKHSSEKSFSLGKFEDNYIRNSTVLVIKDQDNQIVAFANIVKECANKQEVSLDLMRHRNEIENGTMEYLFISLFTWAKENGYKRFNMGLSPLAGAGLKPEDPIFEKAINFIYKHINQFYNFKGLHGFKDKFHPNWSPRYLIYPGNFYLIKVAIAIIEADSGNNILVDSLRRLLKIKQ